MLFKYSRNVKVVFGGQIERYFLSSNVKVVYMYRHDTCTIYHKVHFGGDCSVYTTSLAIGRAKCDMDTEQVLHDLVRNIFVHCVKISNILNALATTSRCVQRKLLT